MKMLSELREVERGREKSFAFGSCMSAAHNNGKRNYIYFYLRTSCDWILSWICLEFGVLNIL